MKFKSKYRGHRLVMKPDRVELSNAGRNIVRGSVIQFNEFLFETTNKKEIKFLKDHQQFGVTIFALKSKKEQEDEAIKKGKELEAKQKAEVAAKKKAAAEAKKKAEEEAKANQSN